MKKPKWAHECPICTSKDVHEEYIPYHHYICGYCGYEYTDREQRIGTKRKELIKCGHCGHEQITTIGALGMYATNPIACKNCGNDTDWSLLGDPEKNVSKKQTTLEGFKNAY